MHELVIARLGNSAGAVLHADVSASQEQKMPVTALAPLIIFTMVSTMSPGGATTLATASGANFGFRRSVPLLAGIAVGLASMAAAAAAGLGSVVHAAPSLQWGMKMIGSAYLLFLAWQMLTSGRPGSGAALAKPSGFIAGAWLVLYNPKGWAMTLGAAASFATLAEGPISLALLLGITFGLCAALSLSLWCMAGLLLSRTLRTDAQWRILNVGLGALLAASIVPMWL